MPESVMLSRSEASLGLAQGDSSLRSAALRMTSTVVVLVRIWMAAIVRLEDLPAMVDAPWLEDEKDDDQQRPDHDAQRGTDLRRHEGKRPGDRRAGDSEDLLNDLKEHRAKDRADYR